MKSLIISLVLVLVIVGVCLAGVLYVDHTVHLINQQLQACILEVEQGNWQKAKALLSIVEQTWAQKRKFLMMYTHQDVLDEIDDHLICLTALADHHPDEFVPNVVLCMNKLNELHHRESVSLDSWF